MSAKGLAAVWQRFGRDFRPCLEGSLDDFDEKEFDSLNTFNSRRA